MSACVRMHTCAVRVFVAKVCGALLKLNSRSQNVVRNYALPRIHRRSIVHANRSRKAPAKRSVLSVISASHHDLWPCLEGHTITEFFTREAIYVPLKGGIKIALGEGCFGHFCPKQYVRWVICSISAPRHFSEQQGSPDF